MRRRDGEGPGGVPCALLWTMTGRRVGGEGPGDEKSVHGRSLASLGDDSACERVVRRLSAGGLVGGDRVPTRIDAAWTVIVHM